MPGKFLKRLLPLDKTELSKALLMSSLFFFIIATFWILKPIKRGLLIGYYKEHAFNIFGWQLGGAETEQLAKVLNMFAAFGLSFLFAFIARKMTRQQLLVTLCGVTGTALLLFAYQVNQAGPGTIWSLYVFGDMFNTAMVTFFWAYMSDIVSSDEAKRSYGIVGFGGVLGGLVGATVVQSSVKDMGRESMLLICLVPVILIAVIGLIVNRRASNAGTRNNTAAPENHTAREGLKLLLRSRYLLAIAGIVGFYEITSNIVDFQLSASVERFVTGSVERDAYFGFVGQLQGGLSILVQLFVTSFVMRRFGVGTALLFLPISLLIGSMGFLIMPTLAFASLMSISDNSFNYSINQSAKEALYVPTDRAEKYQAKAFIDMFIQRAAKVVAVGLNLLVVSYVSINNVRWLSLACLVTLTIWILIVRYAGKRFEEISTAKADDGGVPHTGNYQKAA